MQIILTLVNALIKLITGSKSSEPIDTQEELSIKEDPIMKDFVS